MSSDLPNPVKPPLPGLSVPTGLAMGLLVLRLRAQAFVIFLVIWNFLLHFNGFFAGEPGWLVPTQFSSSTCSVTEPLGKVAPVFCRLDAVPFTQLIIWKNWMEIMPLTQLGIASHWPQPFLIYCWSGTFEGSSFAPFTLAFLLSSGRTDSHQYRLLSTIQDCVIKYTWNGLTSVIKTEIWCFYLLSCLHLGSSTCYWDCFLQFIIIIIYYLFYLLLLAKRQLHSISQVASRWPDIGCRWWSQCHFNMGSGCCKFFSMRLSMRQQQPQQHAFNVLCSGLPGWAGTRKVKPAWIYRSKR